MSTNKIEAAIFADTIQQARIERGWSRYQLAKVAGMNETHLAKIEQGEYCVRIDIANRLCKALNITIDFPIN